MATALATEPTSALELATATWRFWVNRGLIAEGARSLTLALNASKDRTPLRVTRIGRDVGHADPPGQNQLS